MGTTATEVTVLANGAAISPLPRFDGARHLQYGAVTSTIANGVDTVTLSLKDISPLGEGNCVALNGEVILAWGVNGAETLGIAITTKGVRTYTVTGALPTTSDVWAADVALAAFDTAVAWGAYGSENYWDIVVSTPTDADGGTVTVIDHIRGTSHAATLTKTGIGPLTLYAGWPPATLRALIPFCFGCALAAYSPIAITLVDASIAAGDYSTVNAAVGALATTDLTTGETITYTLVAGVGATDNASYAISGANLMANAILTAGTDTVRVRATSSTGRYAERQFVITTTA